VNTGEKPSLAPLLPLLEKGIVALLRLDPLTMDSVRSMADKVIAVDLLGVGMTVYVVPYQEGVHLLAEYDGDVHVRIRGTPLALLAMATTREAYRSTFSGDVEIIGDLVLSRQIQSVVTNANIDWEELLSNYVGDIAAHQLGRMYSSFSSWLKQTRQTLELDVAEYVRAEINLLPEPDDVKEFVVAVDSLRADTDRLEARLKRLKRRLSVTR
jgi:ubiquinone biosynthesis accessory factor UbiJ